VQSSSQNVTTNKPTPSFLQARCPFCRPTNSVKALKGNTSDFLSAKSVRLYLFTTHAQTTWQKLLNLGDNQPWEGKILMRSTTLSTPTHNSTKIEPGIDKIPAAEYGTLLVTKNNHDDDENSWGFNVLCHETAMNVH